MLGFDKDKCARRNRLAATRFEVEAVPIKFVAGDVPEATAPASGETLLETSGALPETTNEALAAINALLPDGASALTADDVYIHFIEAANDNFIGDRYMFLSEKTLRNIAVDAAGGIAFMNSHRTGGLSAPSELPFGKTFAGQYQSGTRASGEDFKRSMFGIYLLRGVRPNGDGGPSTDDLHRMIVGGQVSDVSVGLGQGEKICDVCASELRGCNHYPGTKSGMSDAQVAAQTKRGVRKGAASYTLDDARLGEVSAVFDGAVPGAGIRKALGNRISLAANGAWDDALDAFAPFLAGDNEGGDVLNQITEAVRLGVELGLNASTNSGASAVNGSNIFERECKYVRRKEGADHQPADNQNESPAQFAAMQEQLKAAEDRAANSEKEALESRERIARLERDARLTRLRDTAKDFSGETEKKIGFMDKLAVAFGEDSEELQGYIQQEKAAAEQIKAGKLFSEAGRDGANVEGNDGSAFAKLEAEATKLRAADQSLTGEAALARACELHPKLYEDYRAEQTSR